MDEKPELPLAARIDMVNIAEEMRKVADAPLQQRVDRINELLFQFLNKHAPELVRDMKQ